MILVYDFKLPLMTVRSRKAFKEKPASFHSATNTNTGIDRKNAEKRFYDSINSLLVKGGFAEETSFNFKVKIVKQSLDLRQKEPKAAFTAVIYCYPGTDTGYFKTTVDAGAADTLRFEDVIIGLLLDSGIKARRLKKSEADLYYYKICDDFWINPSIEISTKSDNACDNKLKKPAKISVRKPVVMIAGMGPAGIFAALTLLHSGIKLVLIEKGKRVEERENDVNAFFKDAVFNEASNIVFGEGGAGTFSDGKLTTRKNDYYVGYVMDFLVKMGAEKSILTENRPHLGSDVLVHILKNIRKCLIDMGLEIHYEEELNDIFLSSKDDSKNGKLKLRSVQTNLKTTAVDYLILAIGENNYKTYEILHKKGLYMEKKPFAVGFRIEHSRDFIDGLFLKKITGDGFSSSPSGKKARIKNGYPLGTVLSSVSYNLSSKSSGGYTFCMCPGGVVIGAGSKTGHIAVNGMSYSKRDFGNSNSAIVAVVKPETIDQLDLRYREPLGGLVFRSDLEKAAFKGGGGSYAAPFQPTIQYLEDVAEIFKNGGILNDFFKNMTLKKGSYPEPSYRPNVNIYNLSKILPSFLNRFIASSLIEFDQRFRGFALNSVLTGVETGTSSPVRIKRNADYESVSIEGIFPCGEGSGYSGGIITSAIDGIKCARAVIAKISSVNG